MKVTRNSVSPKFVYLYLYLYLYTYKTYIRCKRKICILIKLILDAKEKRVRDMSEKLNELLDDIESFLK